MFFFWEWARGTNAIQASKNLWIVLVVPSRIQSGKSVRDEVGVISGDPSVSVSGQRARDHLHSCKGLQLLSFPWTRINGGHTFQVPQLVTMVCTSLSRKPEITTRMFLRRHLFLMLSQCKVGQIKHYPIWNSLWKCEQNVKLINPFSCPSCMTVMKTEQTVLWQNASNY